MLAIQEVKSEDQTGTVDAGERSPRPIGKVIFFAYCVEHLTLILCLQFGEIRRAAAPPVGIHPPWIPGNKLSVPRLWDRTHQQLTSVSFDRSRVHCSRSPGDVKDRGVGAF